MVDPGITLCTPTVFLYCVLENSTGLNCTMTQENQECNVVNLDGWYSLASYILNSVISVGRSPLASCVSLLYYAAEINESIYQREAVHGVCGCGLFCFGDCLCCIF